MKMVTKIRGGSNEYLSSDREICVKTGWKHEEQRRVAIPTSDEAEGPDAVQ